MSLVDYTNINSYGRIYNVEYEMGNGKLCTFSNVLVNIDNKYFWFDSPEDGLAIINQDRVVTMVCQKEIKKIL